MNIKNKNTPPYRLLSVIAAVVCISLTVYLFAFSPKKSVDSTVNTPIATPATAQEKSESDSLKEHAVSTNASASNTVPTHNPVSISILSAKQSDKLVEVRAIITDAVEDGGICTFTFTGNNTITKTTVGMADASSTVCPALSLDASIFTNGTWTVTVGYASSKSQGASTPAVFEVKL